MDDKTTAAAGEEDTAAGPDGLPVVLAGPPPATPRSPAVLSGRSGMVHVPATGAASSWPTERLRMYRVNPPSAALELAGSAPPVQAGSSGRKLPVRLPSRRDNSAGGELHPRSLRHAWCVWTYPLAGNTARITSVLWFTTHENGPNHRGCFENAGGGGGGGGGGMGLEDGPAGGGGGMGPPQPSLSSYAGWSLRRQTVVDCHPSTNGPDGCRSQSTQAKCRLPSSTLALNTSGCLACPSHEGKCRLPSSTNGPEPPRDAWPLPLPCRQI